MAKDDNVEHGHQGRVKDPKNDGRLKENRDTGRTKGTTDASENRRSSK